MKRFSHIIRAALTAGALCLPLQLLPAQATPPVEKTRQVKVFPLPGGLNQVPVFNSNSPEVVQEPGILLSTLPGPEGIPSAFLNYAFQGDFNVFAHHIAKDATPGERLLYLGLLASNQNDSPITLELKAGASYLSQPDAPFNRPLPTLRPNPEAQVYAGPGDRVSSELLLGKSQFTPTRFEIPARSTVLVSSLPIPTDVAVGPPINGRSTLMKMHSSGPVYLSHVALFARREGAGFVAPTLQDYQYVLNERKLAGPREAEPTPYDPQDPPPANNFRYGRVAGVQQGSQWTARFFDAISILQMPAAGEISAFPLSSLYLKRYGTSQNQSAPLLRRYPDTARQAHGNYGVHYDLHLPLNNPDPFFRNYAIRLSQPARISGPAANTTLTYIYPPDKQVVFRGTIKLNWIDEFNLPQEQVHHLVLHQGEEAPPLALLTVPPGRRYDLRIQLIYPADAIPPQLLTLERLD